MPIYRFVNKAFFKEWNPVMAYVLGFLFADGNVVTTKRGTQYFALHSMDKEILAEMRTAMNATQKLSKRSERSGFVYRLQIGSKEMVADLYKLGLIGHKASRMKFPSVPREYFPHFIRGYFDGDGNVWSGDIHTKRKQKTITVQASFTSASNEFLQEMVTQLRKKGIAGGSLYQLSGKKCSRLTFSKNDALKLYELMYNSGAFGKLYLERKKAIFEAFLKMRT